MFFLPRRLYTRLVLLGALAVAMTLATFSYYITDEQMEFAEQAIGRDAIALAEMLAEGSAGYVAEKNYARVERDFRQAAHREAVLSLALTDVGGRVLVHVRRAQMGGELEEGAADTLPAPPRAGHVTSIQGDRAVAWHPVDVGGLIGWVRAEISLAEDEAVRRHIWRDTGITTLLAILGSALLFAFFLRRPMQELKRATDFAVHLDRERGAQLPAGASADELEQLVDSLNSASSNLRLQEEVLKKEQAALEIRNRIFQLLATGGSLQEILNLIVESVEMERPGMIGSVLLVDATGKHLVHGNVAGLPEEYRKAIDGFVIGEDALPCGTAAYRGARVIIADIAAHAACPTPFRELALRSGLAACWSEPIQSYRGAVIGTFALYSREPRAPTPADIELLVHAAHFASVAVERKRIEEELLLASSVYQASGEAMFVTDADNRIIAVNPAFTRLTGYEAHEVIGRDPKMLGSDRNDKTIYIAMWQSLQATGQWQGEIWNRRKNGDEYAEWLTITTIRNERGELHRRIALFSDITQKKQAEELIWQQANYDPLTGLPNRRLFRDRLRQELRRAQRAKKELALLFIDLDRFKEVNDALGHDAGDQLLIEAAQRIVGSVRETDTVARLGGDEFTVTLPGLGDPNAVERVAQAIGHALEEPFTLQNEVAYVSASIGITLFPDDAADMETLLKNADQAMYAAKQAGRNGYSWFTPAMQHAARTRRQLVRDLRGALGADQFEVYYQPIVELATGRIVKAEALLRWHHPVQGTISPTVFIPLAEEVGLIRDIGNWVFRQVVMQARAWCDGGVAPFQISVNKSPRQFALGSSHEEWLDYLREIGLPPKCLIVEITEGLLLDERPEVAECLRLFREAGVEIAIDDFGTGYSALSYLQKFDIDYVKIDKSFISDLTTDSDDRALAEAIVVMAHKLGLKVVAEGVETAWQSHYLAAVDCDYGQGYLYAKPLPAAQFEALLKSGQSFG